MEDWTEDNFGNQGARDYLAVLTARLLANINQVVIFRRADDWRLLATILQLRPAFMGREPCPADEIWVSDSDLIIVPKTKILVADDFIDLVFTRGIYRVFPFSTSVSWTNLSPLVR